MDSIDTKSVILERTFELLLIKGYDGVSISDIQKATGMARGLLYHYFGNKEELFIEVTHKYFVDLFSVDTSITIDYNILDMIDYTVNRYSDLCKIAFDVAKGCSDISMMNYDFLFYRVMQESDSFAKKYNDVRDHELIVWEQVLHNAYNGGLLKDGLDFKRTARNFGYLMDGVWMNAVNNNDLDNMISDLKNTLMSYYSLISK